MAVKLVAAGSSISVECPYEVTVTFLLPIASETEQSKVFMTCKLACPFGGAFLMTSSL